MVTYTNIIENLTFNSNQLLLTGTAGSSTLVRGCTFQNLAANASAVVLDGVTDVRIEGCTFKDLGHHGVFLSTTNACSNVLIYNNSFTNCSRTAIASQEGPNHANLQIIGNTISNTAVGGTGGADHAIYCVAPDFLIEGNSITNSPNGSAISVGSSGRVRNNTTRLSGYHGIRYSPTDTPGASNRLVIEHNDTATSSQVDTASWGIYLRTFTAGAPVVGAVDIRYNRVTETSVRDIGWDTAYANNGITVTSTSNIVDGVGPTPPTFVPTPVESVTTPSSNLANPYLSNLPVPTPSGDSVLVMNFENGITDETATSVGANVPYVGTLAITATSIRPGGASITFDGSSYVNWPDDPRFTLGSGNWVIEAIVQFNKTGVQIICAQSADNATNASVQWYKDATEKMRFDYVVGSTRTSVVGVTTLSLGVPYYLAMVRSGTNLIGHVGAITSASTILDINTSISGTIADSSRNFRVGGYEGATSGATLLGKLYGFRLSVGTNRNMASTSVAVQKVFPIKGNTPDPVPAPTTQTLTGVLYSDPSDTTGTGSIAHSLTLIRDISHETGDLTEWDFVQGIDPSQGPGAQYCKAVTAASLGIPQQEGPYVAYFERPVGATTLPHCKTFAEWSQIGKRNQFGRTCPVFPNGGNPSGTYRCYYYIPNSYTYPNNTTGGSNRWTNVFQFKENGFVNGVYTQDPSWWLNMAGAASGGISGLTNNDPAFCVNWWNRTGNVSWWAVPKGQWFEITAVLREGIDIKWYLNGVLKYTSLQATHPVGRFYTSSNGWICGIGHYDGWGILYADNFKVWVP